MKSDLRREVAECFGDFFAGFAETDYLFDAASFGNELLELAAPDGTAIRFIRDRGQVLAELKRKGAYVGAHGLLLRLGVDAPPRHALPPLARDLTAHWDELVALL